MHVRFAMPIVLFLVFVPGHAISAPDAFIKSLMNEPASLFDLGMDRLKKFTTSTLRKRLTSTIGKKVSVVPEYNVDKNLIVLRVFLYGGDAQTVIISKQKCSSIVLTIRNLLTVKIADFFSHNGYQGTGRSKSLELLNFNDYVFIKTDFQNLKSVNCRAMLSVEKEILYEY